MNDGGNCNSQEEDTHWKDVMRSCLSYEEFVEVDLRRRQAHLNRLPDSFMDRLPQTTFDKLVQILRCGKLNQDFFTDMVDFQAGTLLPGLVGKLNKDDGKPIHISQMHRNQAILHSMAREWSAAGLEERQACFQPLLDELTKRIPLTFADRYTKRILIPGCGAGRLPVEISALGYCAEGNEFSVFMLLASNFVMNGCDQVGQYELFPWIERVCNCLGSQDPTTSVTVPDQTACGILEAGNKKASDDHAAASKKIKVSNVDASVDEQYPRLSMAAGDFVEIYGHARNRACWDGIVTCFFIDTAPVVVEYIEVIWNMLKPGAVWINQGPLLYHWATGDNTDDRYDQSIELSWEEVSYVIKGFGFELLDEGQRECSYARDGSNSMMWTMYNTVYFTARKPLVEAVSNKVATSSVFTPNVDTQIN